MLVGWQLLIKQCILAAQIYRDAILQYHYQIPFLAQLIATSTRPWIKFYWHWFLANFPDLPSFYHWYIKPFFYRTTSFDSRTYGAG